MLESGNASDVSNHLYLHNILRRCGEAFTVEVIEVVSIVDLGLSVRNNKHQYQSKSLWILDYYVLLLICQYLMTHHGFRVRCLSGKFQIYAH